MWDTLWCWWDTAEIEFTEVVVVLGQSSLTLEDRDGDSSLLVLVSGEDLGFLGWNDSTSVNQFSDDTADGLNTKSKWSNINKKDILGSIILLTTKDSTLDSSTVSDGLIRVDTSVWLLSIEVVLD